jgi:hypothetical protein
MDDVITLQPESALLRLRREDPGLAAQIEAFVAQLTHIPDPGLRRYCSEQIASAGSVAEMDAAVRLVEDLSRCFDPAGAPGPVRT